MANYRQLVYMVLDELKGMSDDFTYTEDHILFLLDKYRALTLKQSYSDIKKIIPESNYQELQLNLKQVPAISGERCEGGVYLRSEEKIPFLMKIGIPRVYPVDYYQGNITYISRDRMRYVGYNKYLQNIIYCSLGPDNYLYFKSCNPQFLHLEKVKFNGVFQNSVDASNLSDIESSCDVLDRTFPVEDALIPAIIDLVIKELGNREYLPADKSNNAHDDLPNIASSRQNG